MNRSDVLTLVSESPAAHGIFEPRTENQRTVFCTVKSVGYNEFYRGMQNGIEPTLIFILADYAEYQGEKICIYNGTRYRVVRTYEAGGTIELTVEEITVDMTAPEEESDG